MQQLQFVELDEAGRLVLSAEDGTRYAVTVDDRLRSSLRPRPHAPSPERRGSSGASPRDIQAMIRAGQTAQEVAQSTGWEVDRVRRFEGPVLAEREHVVGLAQRAPVRAHGRTDGSHHLLRRVRERLLDRGVELSELSWDAARHSSQGPWTVLAIFSAGGRERRAAWHYDVSTRSIEALDDEARWLSEDEQALPGGLAGHPLLGASHSEDEAAAELMATMRERRQRRGRRTPPRPVGPEDPAHVPGQQLLSDDVLPLEDLAYDPATMGDPPAAHPRGSAPESPSPVDEVAQADAGETEQGAADPGDEPAQAEPETKAARTPAPRARSGRAARRERRRLRMPKLPAVDVGAKGDTDAESEAEPDGSYARTRPDPHEVSFDEFFGTDEDLDDEAPEDLVLEDDADEIDEAAGHNEADAGPDQTVADEPAVQPVADEAEEPDREAAAESVEHDTEKTVGDAAERPAKDDGAQPVGEAAEQSVEDDDSGSRAEPQRESETEPKSEPEPPPQKTSSRKGRTSVPSWDDIMFGSRDQG